MRRWLMAGMMLMGSVLLSPGAHAKSGEPEPLTYQPVADVESQPSSPRWVTHVEPVSHLDAAIVRRLVEPLISRRGELVVHVPGPGVIITDDVARVDKAVRLLRLLDHPMGDDEEVRLFDAHGLDVVQWSDAIRAALPRRGDVPHASRAWRRLITDQRRNIIVVVANPETLQAIEAIRDRLIHTHKLL